MPIWIKHYDNNQWKSRVVVVKMKRSQRDNHLVKIKTNRGPQLRGVRYIYHEVEIEKKNIFIDPDLRKKLLGSVLG